MPQTTNRQGHDYEMPPALIGCLIHGTTWALWCPKCPREVIVDVIGLLERHELYDPVRFDKAVCKHCGAGLKSAGGYVLRGLQFRQRIPRLVTADGSNWRRPDLFRGPRSRPADAGAVRWSVDARGVGAHVAAKAAPAR